MQLISPVVLVLQLNLLLLSQLSSIHVGIQGLFPVASMWSICVSIFNMDFYRAAHEAQSYLFCFLNSLNSAGLSLCYVWAFNSKQLQLSWVQKNCVWIIFCSLLETFISDFHGLNQTFYDFLLPLIFYCKN